MNSINLHSILSSIEHAIGIQYNDGTVDNLDKIKKTKEKISKLEEKLLYSNHSRMYDVNDKSFNKNGNHKIIRELNNNRKRIIKFREEIKENINDIELIVLPSAGHDFFIKLKNGKIHNDKGPAIIIKYNNTNVNKKELYYINDQEISKENWIIIQRKYKINKIKSLDN
jgi:hypothetical protein